MRVVFEAVSAKRDPQIRFMKLQLEILKSRLPGNRVILSPEERARLLKMGETLDHGVDGLMGIVNVKTYRRWLRDKAQDKPARQVGRRRTIKPSLHKLIVRMARENHLWGVRRILGELLTLGLTPSRSTVRRISRDKGNLPDPERRAMQCTAIWTVPGNIRIRVYFSPPITPSQLAAQSDSDSADRRTSRSAYAGGLRNRRTYFKAIQLLRTALDQRISTSDE